MWIGPRLNRDDARFPITPKGQCLPTKVEELIFPNTGQWDEDLVRQTFLEVDMKTIVATTIR
jgi:hypothetical protein